jgi:hypothetical protein
MPTALDTPNTYPTFTNKALDEGVFDQLMTAAKYHIDQEFKNQRIQADTYGQVYLGMLEAVLQNSTQYLLGMMLIDEKRRGQDLANQQAEYQLEVLLPLQAQELEEKIRQIIYTTDFVLPAQVAKTNEETRQITYTTDFVLPKQVEKLTAEISLIGKQEDKIDKEIEFLSAKIMTERANTEAGIADSGSLIGKQITLLTAQRLGFAGDIQTKVGKLYADYNAVFQSVQEIESETELHPNTKGILSVAEGIATQIKALP